MGSWQMAESRRQVEALWREAEDAERAGRLDDAVATLRALLEHPCAGHMVADEEAFEDLHRVLRRAGRHDEAIEAKRAAIAAGYRSKPDPEADIAEILLEAGRRAEADELYTALRERDPDDVWLYNSAGFSYRGIDDHESLRWCLDGIDVAMRTGDAEQVVMQLLEMAEGQWTVLGEPADEELVERVHEFVAGWKLPTVLARWGDVPSEPVRFPCSHCGFDPAAPPPDLFRPRPAEPTGRPVPMALSWFPAGEWAVARARWPELAELPEDHGAYSRRIEARVKKIASYAVGYPLFIAPLSVEVVADAAGARAGTPEARAEAAAEMLRLGRAVPWPPGRNDRCWCGSGRKYKHCCGPVPALVEEPESG